MCAGTVPALWSSNVYAGTVQHFGVQELFRHFVCAGINCSSILCVQELFQYFVCAGTVPALYVCRNCSSIVCRNCSGILCMQELFQHFVCAGTVPALWSSGMCAQELFWYFEWQYVQEIFWQ